MARRVIVDYSAVGFARGSRRRRRPRAGLRLGLIAGALVLLIVFGLTGGRAIWHIINDRPVAGSHSLSAAQVHALGPATATRPLILDSGGAPTPSPAPVSAVLSIPYSVQAPNNNWKVFENACEEDAVLMYHLYLDGDTRADIPVAEADPALRTMEHWQVVNWGAEKDLTLDKTGQFAQAFYGYHYQLVPATQDSITSQIAAGHPVIVPVMTHSLQNKYYGATTVYHEVLIKGYNADGVVTNDGGVMQGKNWFYSWSIIFSAIDAQTPKMGQGRVALVLTK